MVSKQFHLEISTILQGYHENYINKTLCCNSLSGLFASSCSIDQTITLVYQAMITTTAPALQQPLKQSQKLTASSWFLVTS